VIQFCQILKYYERILGVSGSKIKQPVCSHLSKQKKWNESENYLVKWNVRELGFQIQELIAFF
jgi:hypothetical protein